MFDIAIWFSGFVAYATGEYVLYVLSLGKRKPPWHRVSRREEPLKDTILFEATTWLGAATWGIILFAVIMLMT